MCGIVGIYGEIKEPLLESMLKKIKHRGPDDEGTFFDGNVALGQVRLSIIDVEGGKQPIFSEDRSKCIVFNGEIYNYKELKGCLKKNHVFSTKTDTEIILHLYEDLGVNCVDKLDGMFTFIIYDKTEKNIFVARDRLGIKPLYCGTGKNTLFFSSEIKALSHCDKISAFPPGHYYTSGGGFVRYYSLPEYLFSGEGADIVPKKINEFLSKAVAKRLVSDVPVGVFLSGGLDSSVIAAIMKKENPVLHSFSVGMENSRDLDFAKEVAGYLDLKHHEYIYSRNDIMEVLPEVIYHLESFDAPLVRSAVPCFFVSQLAKKHGIKVVLTGEGADELFSGYHYLKEFNDNKKLFDELVRITYGLHSTNLQRVDRLTMANSVEARVPFLDIDFLTYVFSIPTELKLSSEYGQEKWLVRKAFQGYLPESVISRPKQKFSEGAGSINIMKDIAESLISDEEFEREKQITKDFQARTKEELYYYRIFHKYYPNPSVLDCIGITKYF